MAKINLLQIQKHQNTLSNMNLDHSGKIKDHEKKISHHENHTILTETRRSLTESIYKTESIRSRGRKPYDLEAK